jgi:integrase
MVVMEQTRSRPARRHGQGSVYFDHLGGECRDTEPDPAKKRHRRCSGQWAGAISLGPDPKRPGKYLRAKVYGRTKAEVQDKLDAKREEAKSGVNTRASYTVAQAVKDWLAHGVDDLDDNTKTLYQGLLNALLEIIGKKKLRDLTTMDVRKAMETLTDRWSDRTFEIAKNALDRTVSYAMANDLVIRNVAALVKPPKSSKKGRPSKSMTLDQAKTLMKAAKGTRLEAYIVLSLTTGIRTEEARALGWDHVDLEGNPEAGIPPHMAVWKSVRRSGDTKTDKSRRTLELPQMAAEALREHRKRQAEDRLRAGPLWQDNGLVFASVLGEPLAAYRVKRDFQAIAEGAGLAHWTPRELRHTFVSVMSSEDVPLEEIARQVGHTRTSTTETIYRHQLKPLITRGAEAANRAFG